MRGLITNTNKMYSQRAANIPVFRGCAFGCVYCSFKRLIQMNKKCPDCAEFKPHSHMEVLKRTAPTTRGGNFVTVGLSSDISLMNSDEFYQVLEYCYNHPFTTFLIQSKNPEYFLSWQYVIPRNVILGTTIETNRNKEIWTIHDPLKIRIDYTDLSQAPAPYLRTTAMVQSQCRKAVTMEPIMDFDVGTMLYQIKRIAPEFVYIGYANDAKQGKRLRLPEPLLEKTLELIAKLREAGVDVREKTLRKAFYE